MKNKLTLFTALALALCIAMLFGGLVPVVYGNNGGSTPTGIQGVPSGGSGGSGFTAGGRPTTGTSYYHTNADGVVDASIWNGPGQAPPTGEGWTQGERPPDSSAQSWDEWFEDALDVGAEGGFQFNNEFSGLAGWSSLIDWGEGWDDFQAEVSEFFCESVILATIDCWIAEACEVDNLTEDPDVTGFVMLAGGETGAWIDAEKTQNLIPLECNETGECPDPLFCKGGLCYYTDADSGDDVMAMSYMYEITYYLYNPGNDDDDDDDNMSHKICYVPDGGDIINDLECLWEFKDHASETEVLEGESYSFYGSNAVPLYSPVDVDTFCLLFDPALEMIGGTEVDSTCSEVYYMDFDFYTNPAGVPSVPSTHDPWGGFTW